MTATITDLPIRVAGRVRLGPLPAEPSRPLRTPCWLWTGGRFSAGYGSLWLDGRSQLVHRVVYSTLVGALPPRTSLLWLDHVCRVRHCCNPAHLELVTATENQMRRADSLSDTCAHGHLWAENARPVKGEPNQRACQTCNNEKARRYRARSAA